MRLIETRNGAYLFQGAALGRGREAAKRALRGDPALALELENLVRQAAGLSAPAGASEAGGDRCPGAPAKAEVAGLDLVDLDGLEEEFELEMAGVS
jgi:hypothetical protein